MFHSDRYEVQDIIAHGPLATVYRAWDRQMERLVALKVLKEEYSSALEYGSRFPREARTVQSLQHPNIVAVYDDGRTGNRYFRVMELVEGTDLGHHLRSQGVLTPSQAVTIAHEVALGLGAAHRRHIVHRNVKPQNVLVDRDGAIKLSDFGMASAYQDINTQLLTRTADVILSPIHYYAPEQAQGEPITPATDVYALGCVMYEMLTGRTPFNGDTPVAVAMQHIQDIPTPPRQLSSSIPPALEALILRCLEKVPQMRFENGESLAHALVSQGEG
jgi:serine/threonine protein kinase